jgi:ATP-binding cassette subfamily C (CFTR/MRP) protein 10
VFYVCLLLSGGLDGQLEEQGKELSAGQRQLLCLARALVSNAKVICVDEATASIDMETDELIQNTLKKDFVNSTVITIAHRIDTVISCDRILVMDRGRVREYDTPHKLLRDHNSLFYAIFTESRRQ